MMIRPKFTTFLSLEEHYINIISDTSLKVQFRAKSWTEFWGGHWRGVPSPQQESSEYLPSFHNILPVQDWIFSSVSHKNKVSFYDELGKRP
jgi:hypothetical protein